MARILVVDDEPSVLAFALAALSRMHSVRTLLVSGEPDVSRCASMALEEPPDVLLTDHGMPLDPLAIVRCVRSCSPHVRVVLFTASILAPEELARIGADALLGKPCTVKELRSAVAAG